MDKSIVEDTVSLLRDECIKNVNKKAKCHIFTEEQQFYSDIINDKDVKLADICNKESTCKEISHGCVHILELFSGIGGMR